MPDIIRTVSAILYYSQYPGRGDKEILVHRHPKFGVWMGPGGHIEAGELEHVALIREVHEETGLKLGSYMTYGKVDYQRESIRPPNYVCRIALDNGMTLVDYTYYVPVDDSIRWQELVTESDNEMGWYKIDRMLSNPERFSMFEDTRRQVLDVSARKW